MSIGISPGKTKRRKKESNGTSRVHGGEPSFGSSSSGAPPDPAALARGHAPVGLPVNPKYLFTLNAVIIQQFVGETPGGFRIDLGYSAAAHVLKTDKYPSFLTNPLLQYVKGSRLLSGTDWVSVSRQGVVDFDSRITLSLGTAGIPNEPSEPCLISARLRGRGDLHAVQVNGKPRFDDSDGPNSVIAAWRSGFDTGSTLEVMLAVTADVPLEGFDANQTAVYRQCDRLGSSLLLGRATVKFNKAAFGAVDGIELDVFQL
jgi:hypothetical protein